MEEKNKVNTYTCQANNQHVTVTVNRDEGVTPMFIDCPTCNHRAVSGFYRCDQGLIPTHEWYKPTLAEIKRAKRKHQRAYIDHVNMGGLLMRPIEQSKGN